MITLVFGKRGSGKTYLVKKLIRDLYSAVVADVFNEYAPLPLAKTPQDIVDNRKIRVMMDSENAENLFLETISHLKNRTIVIEEIDRFCSPYWIEPRLDRLVRYGRHKNISIIGVSRRPVEIHRNLTANANEIISFRMIEPNDLKYFRQISTNFSMEIQHLGRYEFAKFIV